MNIYEQIARNKRQSWGIVFLFILLILFIGLGFDYYFGFGGNWPFFTLAAIIISLISSYSAYKYGDKLILFSTHAQPLDLADPKQRQWQNIVEELSLAAGLAVPRTYIIDDPDPNAFATGANPETASLVVTRGLLDMLQRDELSGVAAHELSHIRNFDIRMMLLLAVLLGSVALLSDWAGRFWFRRGRSNKRSEGNTGIIVIIIWLACVILAPLVSQIMAMFVSRRREYLADASGSELTRNPVALAMALEKIESKAAPTRSIHQGIAHLCICDPKGARLNYHEGRLADLFATHPPIEKRIEALKQMAYIR